VPESRAGIPAASSRSRIVAIGSVLSRPGGAALDHRRLGDQAGVVGDLEVGDIDRDPLDPEHLAARPQAETDHRPRADLLDQRGDARADPGVVHRQRAALDPHAGDHGAVQGLCDLRRRIDRSAAVAFETGKQHARALSRQKRC
jgi:hypothetical protein